MPKTVVIDCFPESARRYRRGYLVAAIDVIRATTTAITAVAAGWRCFPVPNLETALELANRLPDPLLCGEIGGIMPDGFHLNNSPAALLERDDSHRPLILLSSSGTRLIHEGSTCEGLYLTCFRNYRATAEFLAATGARIALIGAGSRQQFREEDQMCCAWAADFLLAAGYSPENSQTLEIIERWRGVPVEACAEFRSAEYLRRGGHTRDLDFTVSHINDLDAIFAVENSEVVRTADLVANARF